jgi:ABC-type transporter Mla subunit MlaD
VEEIAMIVTLPACGKDVEVQSLSRANAKRVGQIDGKVSSLLNSAKASDTVKEDKDAAVEEMTALLDEKESLVAELYPEFDFAQLGNRDVITLITVTMDYSLNVPEEEIKNWLRSGNGETTRTE